MQGTVWCTGAERVGCPRVTLPRPSLRQVPGISGLGHNHGSPPGAASLTLRFCPPSAPGATGGHRGTVCATCVKVTLGTPVAPHWPSSRAGLHNHLGTGLRTKLEILEGGRRAGGSPMRLCQPRLEDGVPGAGPGFSCGERHLVAPLGLHRITKQPPQAPDRAGCGDLGAPACPTPAGSHPHLATPFPVQSLATADLPQEAPSTF